MAQKKESSSKKIVTKKGPAKKEIVKSVKPEAKSLKAKTPLKAEEKKIALPAQHVRVQTAEGWKRMMKRQGLL